MLHFDDFVILDGNCSNCSIRHFNEAFASNNNQILVMNFNIQSFESKFDELSAFLDEINTKPHVLILRDLVCPIDNQRNLRLQSISLY